MIRRSGWRFPSFDGRDYQFRPEAVEASPARLLGIPFSARAQESVPCCVSCSVIAAMEILDARVGGAVQLSALFNYFTARPMANRLSGIEIRDGLKAAASDGVCPQSLHPVPFSRDGAERRPSQAAFRAATELRLVEETDLIDYSIGYHRIFDVRRLHDWKAAILQGQPIVVGFHLTSAYMEISAASPVHRGPNGLTGLGGHAVAIVGFDDAQEVPPGLKPSRGALRVLDSRGPSFGDSGQWWLPYALIPMGLIVEAWAIARIRYE